MLFLLVVTATQMAIAQTSRAHNAAVGTPNIEWTPRQMEIDEEVPFGVPITRDFVVDNHSDSLLIINNVRSSCHCTTATWTTEPIAPNGRGVVHITYDALKEGEFYKVMIVFTNQDVDQPAGLVLKGVVAPKLVKTGQ